MAEIGLAASVVGLATTPNTLLQMFNAVRKQIRLLRCNPERRRRLNTLADDLINKLQLRTDKLTVSPTALTFTEEALQSVRRSLDSITQRHAGHGCIDRILRFCNASDESDELVEAEMTLQSLMTQVVVVDSVLQVVPKICNENIELPESQAGLIRGAGVLNFLDTSQSQDLRVIAIHGQPGVGKTTLLNYVWNEVAQKAPFRARAYMQIGSVDTSETILNSQSKILWQLCGQRKILTSRENGRGELRENFKELKAENKPLFLAIDNVFRAEDLEALLPVKLGRENLPTSSCVAVTCRSYQIVETLLRICGLQVDDGLRVFRLEPLCLNSDDSRRVFAECANVWHSSPEYKDLLDAMVPLCGGLPLALTTLGKIFVSERKREAWQRVQKEWEAFDAGGDFASIRNAFKISFEGLSRRRQIAFLDMVSTFYGWPCERVERIVGEDVMRGLIESSLVWIDDDLAKCNQNAVREGSDEFLWYEFGRDGRISMHDLTLQFGESLIRDGTGDYSQVLNGPLTTDPTKASTLRSVYLSSSPCSSELVLNFLRTATSLQTLLVSSAHDHRFEAKGPMIVRASSCSHANQDLQGVQCLILRKSISSRSIMDIKATPYIKEIVLRECHDIEELPNIALNFLERLEIRRCRNFQRFSRSCVKEWHRLKDLTLDDLPALKALCLCICPLQALRIACLPIKMFELEQVPSSLSYLSVRNCENLQGLPAVIVNASSLKSLTIMLCASLVELLPDEEIGNLTSLTELTVDDCKRLKRLPAGMFQNAQSLQRLEVSHCPELVTLPEQIGGLRFLKKLSLQNCSSLLKLLQQMQGLSSLESLILDKCKQLENLPDSICSITSLQHLKLFDCGSLTKLPNQIGALCSLKRLRLMECRKLQEVPGSIGDMSSLEDLDASYCRSLVELPEQIASLTSLRKLCLEGCEKLEKLPDRIGYMSSLNILNLDGCRSLVELPGSIGNLSSLIELDFSNCEGLPEQIGGLTSLRTLRLRGCKKLEKLPDWIGNMLSLDTLDLDHCESLVELPEQIGGLTSLTSLSLDGCKKLEKLPDWIGNMLSLESLYLDHCESLVELPEQIGGLTSLTTLRLRGCKKLEKLPDWIGNMPSLQVSADF